MYIIDKYRCITAITESNLYPLLTFISGILEPPLQIAGCASRD